MPGERHPRISGRRIRGRKLTDWESATRIRGIIGQYGKKSRDAKEEAARQEVLLEQWINLEGAEKTGWYTTVGNRHKGTIETSNIRISRIRLGWTSGNMGNICRSSKNIGGRICTRM